MISKTKHLRRATPKDLNRIAEIEVFNYRLNFYPIFRNDRFYFEELQTANRIDHHQKNLDRLWVYDDGVVKGFIQVTDGEVRKLFVEPVLQGHSIGAALLRYAIEEENAHFLWALEKNKKAIAFYERHGFRVTPDRKPEEGTSEYLVRLERHSTPRRCGSGPIGVRMKQNNRAADVHMEANYRRRKGRATPAVRREGIRQRGDRPGKLRLYRSVVYLFP